MGDTMMRVMKILFNTATLSWEMIHVTGESLSS
jgi:hypothetical protein